MTIPRVILSAGLLTAVFGGLSGCGQGDGGEYRPYTAPVDAEPAGAASSAGPAEGRVDGANVASPAESVEGAAIAVVPAEARETSPITVPMVVEPESGDAAPAVEGGSSGTPGVDGTAAPGIVGANPVAGAAAPPAAPREIKLLVPEKTFRAVGPEGALRVTYDDLDLLKVLNMEPVTAEAPEHFPRWLTDLEGKRIRLRGYMRPDLVAEGLTGFILARDTQACCFGPNTKPYDIIPTMLRSGMTTDYIHLRPFDVVGVFHIDVSETRSKTGDRIVEYLYFIDDAVMIDL
jgi:hypothetical protein